MDPMGNGENRKQILNTGSKGATKRRVQYTPKTIYRHKSEGTEAWVSDNAKHLSVEILNTLNLNAILTGKCFKVLRILHYTLHTVILTIRSDSVISMSTLQQDRGISMHQHKIKSAPLPLCSFNAY